MLNRLQMRNLKRFEEADVPLGSPVVFVGPNNAGKTTALQALALWHLGVQTWTAKHGNRSTGKERVGVLVSRRDLVQLPVPDLGMLWRDQHLRKAPAPGVSATKNVLIEITVEGVSDGQAWRCAMEFDYRDAESMHCRPVRQSGSEGDFWEVPQQARGVGVAYLPPMSGLESNERRIDEGAISVSLGQGKTADALRNLCFQLWDDQHKKPEQGEWGTLVTQMRSLFGIRLEPHEVDPEVIAVLDRINQVASSSV